MNTYPKVLAFVLIVLTPPLVFADEPESPLPPKALKALKKYQAASARIQEQLEKRERSAREKLEEALLAVRASRGDAGDIEAVKAIDAELARLQPKPETDTTIVDKRRALRESLAGQEFEWINAATKWRFEADGTIRQGTERLYWVALSGNEVLTMQRDGSFRLLDFSDDMESCRIRFLPAAQPGKGGGLVRVK